MKTLNNLLSKLLWKVGDFIEAKGSFPVGNCIVSYSLTDGHNEIEVYNPVKGTFLDNVAEWLMLNITDRNVGQNDVWNEHGFASEADYINYKY